MSRFDDIPDPEGVAKSIEALKQYRAHHRKTTFQDIPHLWDLISKTSNPTPIDIRYKFDTRFKKQSHRCDEHLPEKAKHKLHDQLHSELRLLIRHIPGARSGILTDDGHLDDAHLLQIFMDFAQSDEGKTMADCFKTALSMDEQLIPHIQENFSHRQFVDELLTISNIRARRDRDYKKSRDQHFDREFSEDFVKPGYMSFICSPEYIRADEINRLLGFIKSDDSTKSDIQLEKKQLEPFTTEEKSQIAKARAAKRKPSQGISTTTLLVENWLPLILWKTNINTIVDTLDGFRRRGALNSGMTFSINYDTVKTGLLRLGLQARQDN